MSHGVHGRKEDGVSDKAKGFYFRGAIILKGGFSLDSLTSEADWEKRDVVPRKMCNLQMSLSFWGGVDVAMVAW